MKLLRLCVACIAMPTWLYALDIESEETAHAVAHVAGSYAIAHITGVVCKKLGGGRITCTCIGALTALSAGAAKEILDKGNGASSDNTARSMGENLLGTGVGLTVLNLDW